MPTAPSETSVNQLPKSGQEPELPLESRPPDGDTPYAQLSAPFGHTYKDVRGGVELTYITGSQTINRLNHVLGLLGWSFVIVEDGLDQEADEIWVHGRMGVLEPRNNEWVYRDQYGSQKIKRSRQSGAPLDIGFDRMGAATACLKKCASLFGVGLYLMAKPVPGGAAAARPRQPQTQAQKPTSNAAAAATRPALAPDGTANPAPPEKTEKIKCQNCQEPLVAGANGKPPHQIANDSLKEFRRVYCPECQEMARHAKAASG